MLRLFDILGFTLERLWQNRVLVFWALVGLSAAATLSLSLVLYVDAVNTDLLISRLNNPPFAFRFRYLGDWEGNISADVQARAADAVQQRFIGGIGLATLRESQFVRGPVLRTAGRDGNDNSISFGAFNIGVLQGAEDLIEITAGAWPPEPPANTPPDADTAGAIPLLLHENFLYEMGIQVGDTVAAQTPDGARIAFEVAALWRPRSAADPNWLFTPRFFEEILLLQTADFETLIAGQENPITESAWGVVFDGRDVRTSDVPIMLGAISGGERAMPDTLPGVRMDVSPRDGLQRFTDEVTRLTQQLVLVILPVGGLVLYFVSLVAGLLVTRQRGEDAVLRSRGMGRRALLAVHVLEWLILAGSAFGIGLAAAPYVVRLIGQTTSFLQFDPTLPLLEITFTEQALAVGLGTALIAASSGLFLAWRSTRQNITSYTRQSARAAQAWWQRTYLDLFALVPGVYVYYTLLQRGGLVTTADNPFGDPLTFLGPTLFALGTTLLFLRVWPFLLNIGARLMNYTTSISILMALRELTRSIGRYRGTLLMMCFTLSLTGITASMASTIDSSLRDTIDYRIGADAVLITAIDAETVQEEADDGSQPTLTVTGYNVLPVDDLVEIDGVRHVSRIGRYDGRITLASRRIDGTVIGVDRATLAAVAYSRADYSDLPYADLFNLLANNRGGVILSRQVAEANNILINQRITMAVSSLSEFYETEVTVVGFIDYFPTVNPGDGLFLIANLDPIFELVGTPLPHDVWLDVEPGTDLAALKEAVRAIDFPVIEWQDPQSALRAAQAEPARRGVLGFLSVGFVASIVLTLVATIIQNTVSFRAQKIQLGSLRAMGLNGLAVSLYLILIQGISATSGILGGTAIGVTTTLLFLPLMDFSGGLPPYLVRVAWGQIFLVYLVFAGILFAVTLFTTLLVSREQLATVVKLGDV